MSDWNRQPDGGGSGAVAEEALQIKTAKRNAAGLGIEWPDENASFAKTSPVILNVPSASRS